MITIFYRIVIILLLSIIMMIWYIIKHAFSLTLIILLECLVHFYINIYFAWFHVVLEL